MLTLLLAASDEHMTIGDAAFVFALFAGLALFAWLA